MSFSTTVSSLISCICISLSLFHFKLFFCISFPSISTIELKKIGINIFLIYSSFLFGFSLFSLYGNKSGCAKFGSGKNNCIKINKIIFLSLIVILLNFLISSVSISEVSISDKLCSFKKSPNSSLPSGTPKNNVINNFNFFLSKLSLSKKFFIFFLSKYSLKSSYGVFSNHFPGILLNARPTCQSSVSKPRKYKLLIL